MADWWCGFSERCRYLQSEHIAALQHRIIFPISLAPSHPSHPIYQECSSPVPPCTRSQLFFVGHARKKGRQSGQDTWRRNSLLLRLFALLYRIAASTRRPLDTHHGDPVDVRLHPARRRGSGRSVVLQRLAPRAGRWIQARRQRHWQHIRRISRQSRIRWVITSMACCRYCCCCCCG